MSFGTPIMRASSVARRFPFSVDVLINVSDVERSLRFYRDLIGMKLESTWADEEARTRWANTACLSRQFSDVESAFQSATDGSRFSPAVQ
jgi:catechol 2,3-dioxygenase-like lactoylglutathione lyase family enzyme